MEDEEKKDDRGVKGKRGRGKTETGTMWKKRRERGERREEKKGHEMKMHKVG